MCCQGVASGGDIGGVVYGNLVCRLLLEKKKDTHYLEELNHLLGSLFLYSVVSPHQVKQRTTAVRELGTNAIEWGHQRESDRIVTIDYRIEPEKINIDVKDTGPGFDPDNLAHAAQYGDRVTHMM